MTGRELEYIREAHAAGRLSGNGPFTKKCQAWLETQVGCRKALLTHSCTAALEMAALLADVRPGDEVIMPSYTFVSTANAFVLRGGVPVFVDIRPDTLNMDETLVEAAITPRTRVIVPVHYAGVACEMDAITSIAQKHGLIVVEDAAQGVMSAYKGRTLGSIGAFGTYSFHETKNIISGEGGAFLINDEAYIEQAEIVWEKGTDRGKFHRGEVDKYTWQHLGSSFLPGELTAAFLWAQLEEAEELNRRRLNLWETYHAGFEDLEKTGCVRRPIVPEGCRHNGHIYYLVLPDRRRRNKLLSTLNSRGIHAIFHFIPLHSSPGGKKYGLIHGDLAVTQNIAERIVRLPIWVGMTSVQVEEVILSVYSALRKA